MAVSLQAQVLALRTAVEAALAGTSAESRAPEVPWTPGQRLTAQVEAELPGGRYQIRVGTFQFDVDLPVKAQVGDALRLEFVSGSPRVAFALTPDAAQESLRPAAQVRAGCRRFRSVLPGACLPRYCRPAAAVARPPAAAAASVEDGVPLLPAPPDEAAPLVAALKGALDRSGLFYESHLVQWFAGDRPLAAAAARTSRPALDGRAGPAAKPRGPRAGPRRARRPCFPIRAVRARQRRTLAPAPSRWIPRCSAGSAVSWR